MPAVNFENRIPYPFGTVCCKYLICRCQRTLASTGVKRVRARCCDQCRGFNFRGVYRQSLDASFATLLF